jgi:hypothetical protein
MNSTSTSIVVFVCLFGGALLGLALRRLLPDHHLDAGSKDTVKSGAGLISTMSALLLGLLVASAKSSYDTVKSEVTQLPVKIVMMDRVLDHYGPDAMGTRVALRELTQHAIDRMWPETRGETSDLNPYGTGGDRLYTAITKLSPANDDQRALKSQALGLVLELGQMRWLLYEQSGSSISQPMLIVVVAWFTIIFITHGLFAPSNVTVIVTLLVCAASVAGALFLIFELDQPFDGAISISSQPMHDALKLIAR